MTVSDDLVARGVSAGALVSRGAAVIDGRGGGRPEMAQARGTRRDRLPSALSAIREALAAALSGTVRRMAFWRRFLQRPEQERLAACTALDVGTEFAKALVFEVDAEGYGVVRGVGRRRQGLAHMQSGTVADIAAVVDNCQVALQEAEEMAGFRSGQVIIGIAGELVKGFTTSVSQERRRPDQQLSARELDALIDSVQREALKEAERTDHLGDRDCPTSTSGWYMPRSPARRSTATQ